MGWGWLFEGVGGMGGRGVGEVGVMKVRAGFCCAGQAGCFEAN